MAIPSRQIGWGTEENLLWQISKQLEYLTGVTYKSLSELAPTYKVYTALLTQSGNDNPDSITSGLLTIGVTYRIIDAGGDFTNVGSPNNDTDTYFVATGTTPSNWGTASLMFNTGAPVVTVLENTIGNIYWTFNGDGSYFANSDSLFTSLKTTVFIGPLSNSNTEGYSMLGGNSDNLIQEIRTLAAPATYSNDLLFNTPIEIRVYN